MAVSDLRVFRNRYGRWFYKKQRVGAGEGAGVFENRNKASITKSYGELLKESKEDCFGTNVFFGTKETINNLIRTVGTVFVVGCSYWF